MRKNILLLGCGNMIQALTLGMDLAQTHFWCYTPTQDKAKILSRKIKERGGKAEFLGTLDEVYQKLSQDSLDLVMIGCKPQQFSTLIKNLKDAKILTHANFLKATPLSVMAGVSLELLKKSWGKAVIRLMPNTPSKIGQGVLLFASEERADSDLLNLFKSCGQTHWCENEDELKLLTPYCASGPGLFFKMIELWQTDLQKRGVARATSASLLAKTLEGSGKMLFESSESAQVLCDQVTSKGGVTFAALKILEENNLETIFESAFSAALKRNNEIEKQISNELERQL